MIFEGKVWKFGDRIDTDLMMPGSAVMAKPGISDAEASKYCMSSNRPGWATQVQKGDLIIAGFHWGIGSGRPAARLFKALGISVIVADSMSRLFFRNAVNIGLPVLICDGVSQNFDEGDLARVNIETGEVINLTQKIKMQGEALPMGSPPLEIIKTGGLIAFMKNEEAKKKHREKEQQ
ncbi:MAG: 3-isopropylmalate dehydratase [Thermodesulfobacteriota bacterium]|nr:3-isopropylmalate dehydratase [Thermodesulfobacteriota bacterium]